MNLSKSAQLNIKKYGFVLLFISAILITSLLVFTQADTSPDQSSFQILNLKGGKQWKI